MLKKLEKKIKKELLPTSLDVVVSNIKNLSFDQFMELVDIIKSDGKEITSDVTLEDLTEFIIEVFKSLEKKTGSIDVFRLFLETLGKEKLGEQIFKNSLL